MIAGDFGALQQMWESHRTSIRRFLIELGHDLDLADDLLQETYLRAQQGISSFRGGSERAWFMTIAKNVYYSHMRQRYVQTEIPLENLQHDVDLIEMWDRLDLLVIKQAIADLPSRLRTALIMKHYAGFTYNEIASHMRCAIGTAKWQVSEALDRLRKALQIERRTTMIGCSKLNGISLIDYAYGVLPEDAIAKVNAHLKECASCREQVKGLKQVTSMLDALEGSYRMMHFIELDREGGVTVYCASSHLNEQDRPLETWEFQSDKEWLLAHLYQDGEEIEYTVAPHPEWGNLNYTATLHRPVPAGGRLSLLSVGTVSSAHPFGVDRLADRGFRFRWKQGPSSTLECAYIQVVRLPSGAQLVSADPKPDETRSDGTTSLIWRQVLPGGRFFECSVEYRLQQES